MSSTVKLNYIGTDKTARFTNAPSGSKYKPMGNGEMWVYEEDFEHFITMKDHNGDDLFSSTRPKPKPPMPEPKPVPMMPVEQEIYDFTVLDGVGQERQRALVNAGITKLEEFVALDPRNLAEILNTSNREAKKILAEASKSGE